MSNSLGFVLSADTSNLLAKMVEAGMVTEREAKKMQRSLDFVSTELKKLSGDAKAANEVAGMGAKQQAATNAQLQDMRRLRAEANLTANAMRQLPAQFTDVFTQLAGGQNIGLILIQQGGQIRDSFGGVIPALRGVLAMLTPVNLAVAALTGGLGGAVYAFFEGRDQADKLTKSLILTGNAAGLTADGMHFPVGESSLPVQLPELADYHPIESDAPVPPLGKALSWVELTAGEAHVAPSFLPLLLCDAATRDAIVKAMQSLPDGVYDGELMVAGGTSSSVSEISNSGRLSFVAFDILEACGQSTMHLPYEQRRLALEVALQGLGTAQEVTIATTWKVESTDQIAALAGQIWGRGGEGLILKRKASTYTAGKRTKDWVKIKALRTAVLTITGYEAGLNGPFSKVCLVDSEGNTTTVKTLNNAEIRNLGQNAKACIGRKLRIEFQERTADGSYRHPRWDRFEDQ